MIRAKSRRRSRQPSSSKWISGPASQTTSKADSVTAMQAPLDILADKLLHQAAAVGFDKAAQCFPNQFVHAPVPSSGNQCFQLHRQTFGQFGPKSRFFCLHCSVLVCVSFPQCAGQGQLARWGERQRDRSRKKAQRRSARPSHLCSATSAVQSGNQGRVSTNFLASGGILVVLWSKSSSVSFQSCP